VVPSLGKPAAIIMAGSIVLTWSRGGVFSLVAEPAALDLAIALAFGQGQNQRRSEHVTRRQSPRLWPTVPVPVSPLP
jgi:hypothetical protein